ncbi:MAG: class I SAM-dependent methyltransferase [Thermaerobacter sp.]|nr:class I SAM-dependent methyltransferase [Thermaerobacter sp.]
MTEIQDPREFFSKHHQAYVTSARHAHGHDLDLLISGLVPRAGEKGLDVATGGGHTAIRLARAGVQVTVADITSEMLTDATTLAAAEGLAIAQVEAYAESLPFLDGTFDIVTCRRAAHHFRDVAAFLREARRTLSRSGRLGISDMTGSLHGIEWLNRLERLRDPSHHRALAPDVWYEMLVAAGFSNITLLLIEEPMSFDQWLSPVTADTEDGARALDYLRQNPPAEFVRGSMFIKRRVLIWADREAATQSSC